MYEDGVYVMLHKLIKLVANVAKKCFRCGSFHANVFFSSSSFIYLAPTNFLSAGVEYDFGRSIGKPRARSQMSDARTPKARDTPNITV